MLKSLSVKNYALISYVHIDFDTGLTIITGETGAGKSILLGALGLILGKRADLSIVQNTNEKCYVEGVFSYDNELLYQLLQDNDLEDYNGEIIIRREITPQGKSRAFVNDTPVTLDVIQAITSLLIDIHAQHETQTITEKNYFITIIDHIANQNNIVKAYQELYSAYKKNILQHQQLSAAITSNLQQQEFLQFQFQELDTALADTENFEDLEDELMRIENATAIQEWIAESQQILFESENSFSDLNNQLSKLIAQINSYTKDYDNFSQLLEQLYVELKPLQRKLQQDYNLLQVDPEKITILREKQSQINKLLQKHHAADISALRDLHLQFAEKIALIENEDDKLAILSKTIALQNKELTDLAHTLSKGRVAVLPQFESQINALIIQLGMPYGKIMMQQKDIEQLNIFGLDELIFFFAPNKGSKFQTLEEVGSGGEKSRLMLAIKSTTAETVAMPTLIFDEIDTGISGQVAIVVGDLLKKIAQKHQIIAITHLPQVAAKGKKHLYVYKDHSGEKSETLIKDLSETAKVENIAAMLTGDNVTEAARIQALHWIED
jgi:DNA repair protein RecN (Recombination protein N)